MLVSSENSELKPPHFDWKKSERPETLIFPPAKNLSEYDNGCIAPSGLPALNKYGLPHASSNLFISETCNLVYQQ
jgi:hypothetical protein